MLISRCCKKQLHVIVDYYVCSLCNRCCVAIDSSLIKSVAIIMDKKELYDEIRNENALEEPFDQT